MNRRIIAASAALASLALFVAGCSTGTDTPADPATTPADPATNSGTTAGTDETTGSTEPLGEITLAGWSLSTTPEFQTLADGFNATGPEYTISVAEYDATEYDTQMIADLAAGSAPDLYVLKNLRNFYTYADGEQLVDVSDVAATLDNESVSFYEYEGTTYAVPYRQDAWFLYYNVDLFEAAGVALPDGSWTWDDYAAVAGELSEKLEGDTKGTYTHSWQSVIQGFANAQSEGADVLTGEFDHLKPYYERALQMQSDGAMETFGTVTTNSLSYQAQFGTQKAAMLPMGSWYIATLVAQQAAGEAEDFAWGIAPAPQLDASTAGPDNTPVTFGDPTGIGINPAIDEAKLDTAKAFLAYIASEDGSRALADIGITPSVMSPDVTESFFQLDGIATDDLSKWTFENRTVGPENPVSQYTAEIQTLLNEAHSAILSESEGVDAAFDKAEERAKNEILNR